MDPIELDESVASLSGLLSVGGIDQRTKRLGDEITEVLLERHKLQLSFESKIWKGEYLFLGEALLFFAEKSQMHPGVLEAIRRGWYPYPRITDAITRRIDLFIGLQDIQNRVRGILMTNGVRY